MFLTFGILAALSFQADLPAAESVKSVEVIKTGDYSEGVVVDHEGNLYFSHGKIITRCKPDGSDPVTWAETGSPNGHKILADGTHLVCDASRHAVLHLDANGKALAPAATECDGKPLLGPNDLTLDTANGGFYFTDPGASNERMHFGAVRYCDKDGKVTTVASHLAFPNGIVLRPDGKELLVGESKRNRILAYGVVRPGLLRNAIVLADLPSKGEGQIDNQPDGMCLDAEGNLYVAHYGMRQVEVVNPIGEVVRRYDGGNLTTSNVAFGPDGSSLFVTGGEPGALFRLDLGVKGLTILPPKK